MLTGSVGFILCLQTWFIEHVWKNNIIIIAIPIIVDVIPTVHNLKNVAKYFNRFCKLARERNGYLLMCLFLNLVVVT